MKKLIPIIALIPLVILALTPPLHYSLDCTINAGFWLWATFLAGFLAFLFLYQKVSVWLRLFVAWCFVSCFISNAPYISFTMFWSLIACAWYYVLCRKIEDWTPVKKAIQAVFFFTVLIVIMQLLGKDTLLNFKDRTPEIMGTVGNPMMASSLMCILAPFLIFNPLNWIALSIMAFVSGSSGAVLSMGMGILVYAWARLKKLRIGIVIIAILIPLLFAWKTGDFSEAAFRAGRLLVYRDTAKLALKRPLGYGIGTYKVLFPVMCSQKVADEQPNREWRAAHNDWLQILFETGFPGMILLLGWLVSILRRVKNPLKLAGLAILATNMMIHFPMRLVHCAFILIMFLAYCSKGETICGE